MMVVRSMPTWFLANPYIQYILAFLTKCIMREVLFVLAIYVHINRLLCLVGLVLLYGLNVAQYKGPLLKKIALYLA